MELHAVVTESALRLAVGDAKLRHTQLEHLLGLAALPNVTIQVVRPEDGPHNAVAGPFVLFDFGSAARPIVYVEIEDGALYLQEPDQVRTYNMVSADLQRVALGPEQSTALIESFTK